MSKKLQIFKGLIESDDKDILLETRMTYLWNDELYVKTINALNEVIVEYQSDDFFPKEVYYFLTSTVTILLGIMSNSDFTRFPHDYVLKGNIQIGNYIELVEKRKKELHMLQEKFFFGKLFMISQPKL